MGSRRYDDDDDDYDRPPRRRRRYDDDYDDYDDYDRPRRRPRRRSSSAPNVGKLIAIIVGSLAAIGVVVALVLTLKNSSGGLFGSGSINYEQYGAITEKDTIEGLEQKHGRGLKIDPNEWSKTGPGFEDNAKGKNEFWVQQGSTLSQYNQSAREVTTWYRWKKGKEEVYIAEGTDLNGRKGLVLKIYFNPKVLEEAVTKPGGGKPAHPWFVMEQIGVGGKFQFGG